MAELKSKCDRSNYFFWLIVLTVCFAPSRLFAEFSTLLYSPRVERWGIEEVTIHSERRYANPFKDVQLRAHFLCSQENLDVAGFFDGDDTWKVRYMPAVEGACSFSTESNDASLNKVTGRFTVGPASAGNHGDIHVAKTYHFSYADGTPYFLLGTTLYNWVNRDEALRAQTLETLGKSPFTKVRFGLFPKWYIFNRVDPEHYPYVEIAPQQFDFDRFDPRFFAMVEKELLALQKKGIVADIILFHPYDHWGFASMDADHDDAYIRYVVARLSAFRNVWWTMSNEYDLFDPRMTPSLKTKDWDRMFRTLETSDPYSHPRGIHNFADWYDHSKPWITHVIIQDGAGHPDRRLAGARALYKKPVVVDEYGYEGNNGVGWGNLSGAEELSRQWDVVMAGGYGSHGETYVHPGGVLWWAAGGTLVGDSPSRMGFLKDVMMEGPFQDVIPTPEIVQGGMVLSAKGKYYLMRIKDVAYNQHSEIQLEENHAYHVDLIDPWLMKIYSLGETGGGLQAFDVPITPSLLRFTRTDAHGTPLSVQALLAKFLSDPTIQEAPKASPIKLSPKVYSAEFTFGELMDDPRTEPLLKKYLPDLPKARFMRAVTLEQIMQSAGSSNSSADYQGLVRELQKIPVSPQ